MRINPYLGTIDAPHDGSGNPIGFDTSGAYTYHYGFRVRDAEPVTGVIANNTITDFLGESYTGAIDLGWESAIREFISEHGREPTDDETDEMCDVSGDLLIGDWKLADDGRYAPDEQGSAGYAVIVGEFCSQVVFSRTVTRSGLCSPCYPGQADIGSDGRHPAYTLPAELFDRDHEPA